MKIQKTVSPQFEVSASVSYIAAESKPDQNYFFFSYRMSIKNTGSTPAQLMSRHWIITDATGHTEEVRGEFAAIDTALARLQPGDLCLVLVDQVEEALAHLAQRCASAA